MEDITDIKSHLRKHFYDKFSIDNLEPSLFQTNPLDPGKLNKILDYILSNPSDNCVVIFNDSSHLTFNSSMISQYLNSSNVWQIFYLNEKSYFRGLVFYVKGEETIFGFGSNDLYSYLELIMTFS